MAAPILPQDVTEHLTAAIQLSNKHIHLRFWKKRKPFSHSRCRRPLSSSPALCSNLSLLGNDIVQTQMNRSESRSGHSCARLPFILMSEYRLWMKQERWWRVSAGCCFEQRRAAHDLLSQPIRTEPPDQFGASTNLFRRVARNSSLVR